MEEKSSTNGVFFSHLFHIHIVSLQEGKPRICSGYITVKLWNINWDIGFGLWMIYLFFKTKREKERDFPVRLNNQRVYVYM